MIQINYLAVVAGAVASMLLGMLWYGPLFGKQWSALMGFTAESMEAAKKKGMGRSYAAMFIGSLIMAYVLGRFVALQGVADWMGAFHLAFWIWIGFIATVQLGTVIWEGKPKKLYWIQTLYYLVLLFVMALIFAYWK